LASQDRRGGVPILVRQIDEQILLIEPDDRREIVSAVHRSGVTTFAVGPGRNDFAASVRLARLQKAAELAEQLHRILTALPADKVVLDQVKVISDWLKTAKP